MPKGTVKWFATTLQKGYGFIQPQATRHEAKHQPKT